VAISQSVAAAGGMGWFVRVLTSLLELVAPGSNFAAQMSHRLSRGRDPYQARLCLDGV